MMKNDKQRERLKELLKEARCERSCDGFKNIEVCKHCTAYERCAETAGHLLANGVIVPPCKVEDKVYFVFEGDVLSDEITLIEVTESAMYLSTCSERYMLIDGYLYSEMLDEKAYFTKEEAEEALKGGVQG